ncbi:MAG: hypothetical protein Q4B48_07055 [Syntrophomonadaceae bacterium]|nr:hypothetical protein [Syntrophomonadaceae bacterium]
MGTLTAPHLESPRTTGQHRRIAGRQRKKPSSFLVLTTVFALSELALLAGWWFSSGTPGNTHTTLYRYFVLLPLCYSLPAGFCMEEHYNRSRDLTNKGGT